MSGTDNVIDKAEKIVDEKSDGDIDMVITPSIAEPGGRENVEEDKDMIIPKTSHHLIDEDDNDTPDTRCEYLNNGVAVGVVEICSDSRLSLIQGTGNGERGMESERGIF